jgi:hypothetical protein
MMMTPASHTAGALRNDVRQLSVSPPLRRTSFT